MMCLASLVFVAAFHICGPGGTIRYSTSAAAVYAASDDTAPSSATLVIESCHICTVIVSSDLEAGDAEHGEVPLKRTLSLLSVDLKTTGPPPKA